MEMKQIYQIVNTVSQEVLGESALVQEDLGNIVDIGTAVFDNNSFDKFVRSLVDHIGRVVFVDRVYRGRVPSIVRDGWEYGAVLEKLACKLRHVLRSERVHRSGRNRTLLQQEGDLRDPDQHRRKTVPVRVLVRFPGCKLHRNDLQRDREQHDHQARCSDHENHLQHDR